MHLVGDSTADDDVVLRGALDVLNPGQAVIALTSCGAVIEIDVHRCGRRVVVHDVDAIRAEERVGTRASDETVVADPTIDEVIPRTTVDSVTEVIGVASTGIAYKSVSAFISI